MIPRLLNVSHEVTEFTTGRSKGIATNLREVGSRDCAIAKPLVFLLRTDGILFVALYSDSIQLFSAMPTFVSMYVFWSLQSCERGRK